MIEDDEHTEFALLNRLLIWFLREGFVNMTGIKQEEHRKKINRKWKRPSTFTISAIMVVIGMAGLQIFKSQVAKN